MDIFCDLRPVQSILQIDSLKEMIPVLRNPPNLYEPWMLIAFLLMFISIGYMRKSYARRLHRLFSSLVRLQILRQVMREELVFSHRISVLLFLNFAMVSSMVLYGGAKYYDWNLFNLSGWELYLALLGIVISGYLLKLIVGYILRKLYHDPGLIREYLFEVILIDKALGVILLPFAVAISFMNIRSLNILFSIVVFITCLFLLFRIVQGLIMSISYPVSRVYIILYLCTLEILPFLVVFKIFTNQIA